MKNTVSTIQRRSCWIEEVESIEEEESIKAKFALMKDYNLAGAAYWQKDFERASIWDIVAEEIK